MRFWMKVTENLLNNPEEWLQEKRPALFPADRFAK